MPSHEHPSLKKMSLRSRIEWIELIDIESLVGPSLPQEPQKAPENFLGFPLSAFLFLILSRPTGPQDMTSRFICNPWRLPHSYFRLDGHLICLNTHSLPSLSSSFTARHLYFVLEINMALGRASLTDRRPLDTLPTKYHCERLSINDALKKVADKIGYTSGNSSPFISAS
jgi:hypothetical protein